MGGIVQRKIGYRSKREAGGEEYMKPGIGFTVF